MVTYFQRATYGNHSLLDVLMNTYFPGYSQHTLLLIQANEENTMVIKVNLSPLLWLLYLILLEFRDDTEL